MYQNLYEELDKLERCNVFRVEEILTHLQEHFERERDTTRGKQGYQAAKTALAQIRKQKKNGYCNPEHLISVAVS